MLSEDLYFFHEGSHTELYEKFGGHPAQDSSRQKGAWFRVWAPHAGYVSVVGPFNNWNPEADPLAFEQQSSSWFGSAPHAKLGSLYKFYLRTPGHASGMYKADPYAFQSETTRPLPTGQAAEPASLLCDLQFPWTDDAWMHQRAQSEWSGKGVSLYQVHLPSWRTTADGKPLSYRQIAQPLAEYVQEMGFSHVCLLPVSGSTLSGSASYFAPAPQQGSPLDFMYLVDVLHNYGIGVVLQWTATRHKQTEPEGLHCFDGTHLYEEGRSPYGFRYSSPEVRSFLLSSVRFWCEKYHIDALYIAGAKTLLADPNGRELLQRLQDVVSAKHKGVQLMLQAGEPEEMPIGFYSIDRSRTQHILQYFFQDPYFRRYHHQCVVGRANSDEGSIFGLTHTDVEAGRGSLLAKMAGDTWQKFANLRAVFGLAWAEPGKKLLFMGGEFAQQEEWDPRQSLDWPSLNTARHAQMRLLVGTLNHLYRAEAALHDEGDPGAFAWIRSDDSELNVVSFVRSSRRGEAILVVGNFSPVPRVNYRVGVPAEGLWHELLNTDAQEFGGSGTGNYGGLESTPLPLDGHFHSVTLTLPPLAVVYFKHSFFGV